ncbi:hypothetical protein ACJW30_11G011200 [Castanea mollissima]
MKAFIHHPLVILLTALEACSYMMTCEIKIFIGASGALFVLLGAMVSKLFTNWTIYANKCAALVTLMLIITINLPLGFLPHVDNSAHIEGFQSGFPLGLDIEDSELVGKVLMEYGSGICLDW